MLTGKIQTKSGLSHCLRDIILIFLIMMPFVLQSEGMRQEHSSEKSKNELKNQMLNQALFHEDQWLTLNTQRNVLEPHLWQQ